MIWGILAFIGILLDVIISIFVTGRRYFLSLTLSFIVLWDFSMFYWVLLCLIVCRKTNVSLITVPASGEAIVVIMTTVPIVIEA